MGALVELKSKGMVENFINTYSSSNTIETYTIIIKEFFNVKDLSLVTDYKIKNITYQDAQKFIVNLTDTKSKNTVKQRIGCLRALFNYAIDEKLVSVNPFADRRIKKIIHNNCVKDEVNSGRALSINEIKQLISTIENHPVYTPQKKLDLIRDKLLINFMLRTGCRESEVIDFEMEHIEYNSIKEKYYIKVNGKGNKDRIIQLTETMHKELLEWDKINNKDTVFGFKTVSNINKIVERWGKISGIGNLSPHDMRRTFATNLAEKGISLEKLQKILGHQSIQTTQTYIKDTYRYEQNLDELVTW